MGLAAGRFDDRAAFGEARLRFFVDVRAIEKAPRFPSTDIPA
jgi:hypothetical protein